MPVLLQAEEIGGSAELPGPVFAQEQCHGLGQQQQLARMDDGELDMGGRRPFLHTGESVWLSCTFKQGVSTPEHCPVPLTCEVSAVGDGIVRGDGCRWNLQAG